MKNKEQQYLSDGEILDRFYDTKDNRLLGILLQRYTLLLLGVCMKYLKNEEAAKDGVQQIFLKVIGELQRYKVQYFKSWLYMIARNYCLMQLREKKNTKELDDNFSLVEETATTNDKEKLLTLMEMCLNELNEEQKTCLILFYLRKKTYQQISEATGYSLMQVKSFIQNGKRNLKMLVQKKLQTV